MDFSCLLLQESLQPGLVFSNFVLDGIITNFRREKGPAIAFFKGSASAPAVTPRSYFPETWVWDRFVTGYQLIACKSSRMNRAHYMQDALHVLFVILRCDQIMLDSLPLFAHVLHCDACLQWV